MSVLTDLPKSIQEFGKEEAPQDHLIPAQWVDALVQEALQHRAVNHPYLRALAAGSLPDPQLALRDFAQHYYGYSSHFPRYLTALISRLECSGHRRDLLDNLSEESGHYETEELGKLRRIGIEPDWILGIPHPDLFRRFSQALGVDHSSPASDHIEVVCWREMFLAVLSDGTPAEALGALGLGTETIVSAIYKPFVAAIARLNTLQPRDMVFFPLHTLVDDNHQATLRAIAVDFADTPTSRADLAKGMHKALILRNSFWDWLYQRALDGPKAG
jgi:pyrroloquinoline quinone (PQQ) biosynthesis protein C